MLNYFQTLTKFTDTVVMSPQQTFFSDGSGSFFGLLETPEVPEEFGLYKDLANLNRVLSIFDNPNITLADGFLKITHDQSAQNAKFMTSDLSLIQRGEFDLAGQIERTQQLPKVLKAVIETNMVNKIKTAAGIIEGSKILLKSLSGNFTIIVKDTDFLSSDSDSISFPLDPAEQDKDFQIEMDPQILMMMPKGDILLEVYYNEKFGAYRAVLSQEGLKVVVPTEVV